MIYAPQVQFGFGNSNSGSSNSEKEFTPIPPEYLREFTFVSRQQGWYEATAMFFDPTFEAVEEMFITAEFRRKTDQEVTDEMDANGGITDGKTVSLYEVSKSSRDLVAKFGVVRAGSNAGSNPQPNDIAWSPQYRFCLKKLNPSFDDAGMDITVEMHAWQVMTMGQNPTTLSYTGKRSDVFTKLFTDIGLKPEDIIVEETTDEMVTETNPGEGERSVSTNGYSYQAFIEEKLLVGARSKRTGRTDYIYKFSENGKVAYFGTRGSIEWNKYTNGESQKIKSFNYLCGMNDNVISFKPDFNSDLLGSWGAGSAIARLYDPHTKNMKVLPLNHRTVRTGGIMNYTQFDANRKPTIIDAIQGWDSKTTEAMAEQRWCDLAASAMRATLEIHGSPGTLDLLGGDVINVNVILPSRKLHYSSGLWWVLNATHRITDSYTVSCELVREFGNVGNQVDSKMTDADKYQAQLEAELDRIIDAEIEGSKA